MGKFTEGHTLSKGKRKPGGGRHKTPSTLIKEALINNDQRLPELFDNLYNLALEGDREATINLIDRSLGKVRTKTELEVTRGEDLLSGGTVVKLFQMMDERYGQKALTNHQGQLAELYTRQYGDRVNWPSWAIEAVDHPKVYTAEGVKELTEGVTEEA